MLHKAVTCLVNFPNTTKLVPHAEILNMWNTHKRAKVQYNVYAKKDKHFNDSSFFQGTKMSKDFENVRAKFINQYTLELTAIE